MHFTTGLATLLAVLHVVEPGSAIPVPDRFEQTHLRLVADVPFSNPQSRALVNRLSSRDLISRSPERDFAAQSGRDLAANIALNVDVNASGFRLLSASSKSPSGSKAPGVVRPRTLRGRRFHGHRWHHRLRAVRREESIKPRSTSIEGIPGTIDIMSPTQDDPVGLRLASLSISNAPSETNEFILNASGINASTIYLMVSSEVSLADGSLTVRLGVPVFDQAVASFVPYCATFGSQQTSPLLAAECTAEGKGISNHSSQLFSYDPPSGVLKPLWIADAPANSNTASNATAENIDGSEGGLTGASNTTKESQAKDEDRVPTSPRNVTLVFTPDLDESIPIVNSRLQRLNDTSLGIADTNDDGIIYGSILPTVTDDASLSQAISSAVPPTMPTGDITDRVDDSADSAAVLPVFIVASDEDSSSASEEDEVNWSSDEPADATSSAEEPNEAQEATTSSLTERQVDNGAEMSDDDEDCLSAEENNLPPATLVNVESVDTGYPWKFNPSDDALDPSDFGK
ncbi:hypothetical protein FRC18_007880 [Serendipita sp. 400]|nr:hypothetical protein FRC18_007880 [Serendipita sp. 400]